MEVLVLVPDHVRGWHLAVVDALASSGVGVRLERAGHESLGRDVEALLRWERRLHGLTTPYADLVPPGAAATSAAGSHPDLCLDLSGAPVSSGCWTVTFDDGTGESAAARSLLAGRFPVVRVLDGGGRIVAEGRPGCELPGVAASALDGVLAGTVELVAAALAGNRLRLPAESAGPATPALPTPLRSPSAQARRAVAGSAARRVYRILYRSPHWRVGWRFTDGPGVLERGRLPDDGWRVLPDDGRHFYADPFPIVVDGRTHLFVEDFDHRLGRGVISAVEFDGAGPIGTPRPVLQHEQHLSYPFVLECQGEVWMMPETSAAGTVELYRATDFPDRWELAQVLLRDVDASDATPFRHEGRWWLSATVRRGGSCSDALHLWYADDLVGPWKPHERNPVLVDIASARPAGRPARHAGRLLRPAQDGRAGYGGALAVAEVVDLDPGTFTQRVVARVSPGGSWPGTRLHTVNRAGNLEVVDGSARSPRLRVRRRP
jgi:hypothetical protein